MAKKLKTIVGLDGGNNSIKLVLADSVAVNYENIYCELNEESLEKDWKRNQNRKANKHNIATMLDVKVTSGKDKKINKFIFGKKAERYRPTVVERVNDYKSNDEQLVYNSIVALANTVISKLDSDKWEDEIELDVDLCTGLPFHEYETKDKKEKYLNMFLGNHVIEFLNPAYPVKKMKVNVKNVELEIEGLAALRQTLFDDGVMEKDNILNKVVAMIDIGCFTTDIVGGIFLDDIDDDGESYTTFETQTDLCTGIVRGVGTAMDKTRVKMLNTYSSELGQYDTFSRQEIVRAASNENGEGKIEGTDFSIEPFFTEECNDLGGFIGKKFTQLYNESGYKTKICKIYLAGGGSYNTKIMDSFMSTLEKEGFDKNLVKIVTDPVYANSRGYFNIADCTYGN